MPKMCPLCSLEKDVEKKGMCIHQKIMLGMLVVAAVVLILVFGVF